MSKMSIHYPRSPPALWRQISTAVRALRTLLTASASASAGPSTTANLFTKWLAKLQ